MDRFKDIISVSTINSGKLVSFLLAILVIFITFQLAKITWLVATPVTTTASLWQLPAAANNNNANQSAINFSSYQWFGKFNGTANVDKVTPKAVTQSVTKAPKTKLNLILSGLVASDIAENSMAIIEYRGKQATYGVDDKITGTRALIHQIVYDRVILRNSGKYETLMLDGFDYKAQAVTPQAQPKAKKTDSFSAKLAKSRAEILKDPGKIIEHISITPVREKNKIKGYRLNPGRNPSLFRASGLKHNDLAISINGYDLTDFSESIQVMNDLKTMTQMSLVVERNGQFIDIQFGLTQ